MMRYIGLDVGKTGHIVVINPDKFKTEGTLSDGSIEKFPIPKIGDEVDIVSLANIFQKYTFMSDANCFVGKEKLHSIFGSAAGSNFTFGEINGIFLGILSALHIPYVEINAKKWQKEMFEGIPIMYKQENGKQKVDTKSMSILACSKLFPGFDLRISDRAKVPNHNVADALLIATYTKRHY